MAEAEALRAGRLAMAAGLAEGRPLSEQVRSAIATVPRHRFAPCFFSRPPDHTETNPAAFRGWTVDDSTTDPDVLALIHDPDRALGLRLDDNNRVTSTISAPRLVAWTLDQLHIAPGMRILEIGTGSGYNAALLGELVGDTGEIVSVEIDERLVASARSALAGAGYERVRVVAGDGYEGAPEAGQFDRVVVTVGCPDIAPRWLEQLAPGGFALIPLLHGGVHPVVNVEPAEAGAAGAVIGYSAYVSVMGYQATAALWPLGRSMSIRGDPRHSPLPADLEKVLTNGAGRRSSITDVAYFVALEDHRAIHLGLTYSGLTDGAESLAAVDAGSGNLALWGPEAESLRDALIVHARRWLDLGCPSATDFKSRWVRGATSGNRLSAEWVLPRLDFVQIVGLPAG